MNAEALDSEDQFSGHRSGVDRRLLPGEALKPEAPFDEFMEGCDEVAQVLA
ncbi:MULTISPECIES: hypothetical protein [Cryobacterium]|uniref:hypothetical protein n=1 Tax=Cryobacterium breve TaxID=1259258 RepID=UPI00141AE3E1